MAALSLAFRRPATLRLAVTPMSTVSLQMIHTDRHAGPVAMPALAAASARKWAAIRGSGTTARWMGSTTTAAAPAGAPAAAAGDIPAVYVSVTPVSNGGGVTKYAWATPLPGVPGMTTVSVDAEDTVADLAAALKAKDASIKHVSVSSWAGNRLARTTPLSSFVSEAWTLKIDGLSVGVSGLPLSAIVSNAPGVPSQGLASVYSQVKTAVAAHSAKSISREEFEALVASTMRQAHPESSLSLDEARRLALAWIAAMELEGIVVTFPHSSDDTVRNNVYIQSHLLKGDVTDVLDVRGSHLRKHIQHIKGELELMTKELDELKGQQAEIHERASRYVNLVCNVTTVGLTVQFGVLAYAVYELAWDIMEPFTYFLGVSYSTLFYLFFLRYRQDPDLPNIFGQMLKWRERKLMAKQGFNPKAVSDLEASIAEKHEALNILKHRAAVTD